MGPRGLVSPVINDARARAVYPCRAWHLRLAGTMYARSALIDKDVVDEECVAAFMSANNSEAASASRCKWQTQGIHPVAAASDFTPILERVQHTRKSKSRAVSADFGVFVRLMFSVLRWLFSVVLVWCLFADFVLYVLVRQVVHVFESLFAWSGGYGLLRRQLHQTRTYSEWKRVALVFDRFCNAESWKAHDASVSYDWHLLQRMTDALKTSREKNDMDTLMDVLSLCLQNAFAGVENLQLYSQTYFGTKHLVERYYAEVHEALRQLEYTSNVDLATKHAFFSAAAKNYGRAALCLSGGASFAYYHMGVVRALLDADLLPDIITGTGAGSLIAALVATHTDDELRELLVPELADRLIGCDEPMSMWISRIWRTGALFDSGICARKVQFFTRGSLTFREAYERTGKVLNISVVPYERHLPTQSLNYVTAPDCVVWTAVLATSAVPSILNPVFLLQKLPDGSFEPWSWDSNYIDGNLRVDIPLKQLYKQFHVTFPIVSQVNPHVQLFHEGSRGTPERLTVSHNGWQGSFLLTTFKCILKLHMTLNNALLHNFNIMPLIFGQDWSNLFLQPIGNTVTIWPHSTLQDWLRILVKPDSSDLSAIMQRGQYAAFPRLYVISRHVRLERAIAHGRRWVSQGSSVFECRNEHEAFDDTAESERGWSQLRKQLALPDMLQE